MNMQAWTANEERRPLKSIGMWSDWYPGFWRNWVWERGLGAWLCLYCPRFLVSLEGPLGSRGGCTGCSALEGSVGEDPLRELMLGLVEAGSCSPVLRVNLQSWREERGVNNIDNLIVCHTDQRSRAPFQLRKLLEHNRFKNIQGVFGIFSCLLRFLIVTNCPGCISPRQYTIVTQHGTVSPFSIRCQIALHCVEG